jgi:CheY-like chemotaxis protein
MTGQKILIIEDNEQNLYMMRYLLEKSGYEVAAAMTGKDGIQAALALRPMAILLDIQLPLMDGYSVARELRKIPGIAETPIIVVTSYAMAGDKERALAAGATDYIEKPIDPSTFVSQVAKYCRPRG